MVVGVFVLAITGWNLTISAMSAQLGILGTISLLLKELSLLLQLLALALKQRLVVFLGEPWQSEVVVLRLAEVFLRKDLSFILHALCRVDYSINLSGLDIFALILLRNDVVQVAFTDFVSWTFLERTPILHSSHHLISRSHDEVFVDLNVARRASSV